MKDSVKYGFLSIVGGMVSSVVMLTTITSSEQEQTEYITEAMYKYAESYCAEQGYTQILHESTEEDVMTSLMCIKTAKNGMRYGEEIEWRMFK
jgi:putative hemolysin